MNSAGGSNNSAGSATARSAESSREAGSEASVENKVASRAENASRSESISGMQNYVEQYTSKLEEQKSLRNMPFNEQLEKKGTVKLGIITRNFQGSVGIYEGDKAIVPERTAEQVRAVQEMEKASAQGLMLGARGEFINPQDTSSTSKDVQNFEQKQSLAQSEKPTDAPKQQQLIDPETGEIHIGKHTYAPDQIVAELPNGTKSDAVNYTSNKHKFETIGQDQSTNLGSRNYILRVDRTLDKFDVAGKYLGTAIDNATGLPFKAPNNYFELKAEDAQGNFSHLAGKTVHFENLNNPKPKETAKAAEGEAPHPAESVKQPKLAELTEIPKYIKNPEDGSSQVGDKAYILRGNGRIDKFVHGQYVGSAIDAHTGEPYKIPGKIDPALLGKPNQACDISSYAGHGLSFANPFTHKNNEDVKASSSSEYVAGNPKLDNSAIKTKPDASDTGKQIYDGSPLQGGVEEEVENKRLKPYGDPKGEVPFGDPLPRTGGVQESPEGYYTFTLGVDGIDESGNGVNTDVININIGDKLNLDGHSIRDRQPHRHSFPIKVSAGNSHWRWADATLQMSEDGRGLSLQIHRLSSSKGVQTPSHADEWDRVPMRPVTLPHDQNSRHVDAKRFNEVCPPPGIPPSTILRKEDYSWYTRPNHGRISVSEKGRTRD